MTTVWCPSFEIYVSFFLWSLPIFSHCLWFSVLFSDGVFLWISPASWISASLENCKQRLFICYVCTIPFLLFFQKEPHPMYDRTPFPLLLFLLSLFLLFSPCMPPSGYFLWICLSSCWFSHSLTCFSSFTVSNSSYWSFLRFPSDYPDSFQIFIKILHFFSYLLDHLSTVILSSVVW